MNPRTHITVPARHDFSTILDAWAVEHQYLLQREETTPEGPVRLYQKGTGFLVAPMMLRVLAAGDEIRMEAWVSAGFYVRMMSLFILPAEMTIESGGFKGTIPRKMARKAVNDLLGRLGVNLIP